MSDDKFIPRSTEQPHAPVPDVEHGTWRCPTCGDGGAAANPVALLRAVEDHRREDQ